MQSVDGGPVKIGHSEDVDRRREQLESHYGRPLALLKVMPGGRDEERALHERFAEHRIGRTEQFRPAPDLMEFIGRPLLVGANPDAIEAMESAPARHAVRMDLEPELYRLLRDVCDDLGMKHAVYLRSLFIQDLKSRGLLSIKARKRRSGEEAE